MLNDTKKTIVFLIGGIVLAVSSFLCYYLIEPRNWIIVSILCVVDFLYLFLNAYLFLEYSDKRIIKALGLSLGYIAIFNLIPIGYLLIEGLTQRITEIWKDVLVYSFFTGPCLIIIIFVIFLAMLLYDYAYGHSVKYHIVQTKSNLSVRIQMQKADGKQPSAFKIWVAVSKGKGFSETEEKLRWNNSLKVRN